MEIEIIGNDGEIWLQNGSQTIEKYSFDTEINFSGLMEFLLALNLSTTVKVKSEAIDMGADEYKVLVKIITDIIDSYNKRVYEFEQFKKSVVGDLKE